MSKPLIGLTGHRLVGSYLRSAVGQAYVDAIVAGGGAPMVIPIGLDVDGMRAVFDVLDGLLLPGGDDVHPERYHHEPHPMLGNVCLDRDELELTVTKWALERDMPVLGICRGIQVLAVAAGGTLYQDLPSEWEKGLAHDVRDFGGDHLTHTVSIERESQLLSIIGAPQTRVNSFHHQAVRDLPPGFVASATAEDGVVEAIESRSQRFALGVQCHPEGMWQTTAPQFANLFSAFVDAAAAYQTAKRFAA